MSDISKHGQLLVDYNGPPIPSNSVKPKFIEKANDKQKSYIKQYEVDNGFSFFNSKTGHNLGVVPDSKLYQLNSSPQFKKQMVTLSDDYSQRKVDEYSGNVRPEWQSRPKNVQKAFFDPVPFGLPYGSLPTTGFQASRVVPRQQVSGVIPFKQQHVPPGANIKGVSGGDFVKGNMDTYRPPDLFKTVDELRIIQKEKKVIRQLMPASGLKGTSVRAVPGDTTHWKRQAYRTFTVDDLYANGSSTQAQPIIGFINPDTLTKTDQRMDGRTDYSSGAFNPNQNYARNPDDVANITMRNIYNKQDIGPASNLQTGYARNPDDVANITMRNIYNKQDIGPTTNLQTGYARNSDDTPNITMRNIYNKQDIGSATNLQTGYARNPDDVANITMRNIYNKQDIGPATNLQTGYARNSDDTPNITMRNIYNKQDIGSASNLQTGYARNPDDVANITMRNIYNKQDIQMVSSTNEGERFRDFSNRINVNKEHQQLPPPPGDSSKNVADTSFKSEKSKDKSHLVLNTVHIQGSNQFDNYHQASTLSQKSHMYPVAPPIEQTLQSNPYNIPYSINNFCSNIKKMNNNAHFNRINKPPCR
jgi:hypothetical protein